jgi:exosortase
MTALPATAGSPPSIASRNAIAVVAATAVGFLALFGGPAVSLARDWWTMPEAGHGLLMAPLCLWFGWRRRTNVRVPNAALGGTILVVAALVRVLSDIAAEHYTMRLSMVLALVGLTVFFLGVRQLMAWWLPVALLILSVPLPEIIVAGLALPLQFQASELGAAILRARHVPVELMGNVLRLPGQELFVTEACSGLRSLTALLSLGVLVGGTSLNNPVSRIILVAAAIPIAVVINGVRVFVTGFAVHFISPEAGTGILHATEGWLLFIVAFVCLLGLAGLGVVIERRLGRRSGSDA